MFTLEIKSIELFNESVSEFKMSKGYKIQLEHSLVSISKWESRWEKPFLTKDKKSFEESVDYIRCMTITQNIPEEAYKMISQEHINEVAKYIDAPMTATVIYQRNSGINRESITAEIMYYWMIACNIPLECQKWHLNRLITLINVCNIKNSPPKKMSQAQIAERNRTFCFSLDWLCLLAFLAG